MNFEETIWRDQFSELLGTPLPPARTPQCPPLSRFLPAAWRPEDLPHVAACKYCQRATAVSWLVHCPSLSEVLAYAAAPAQSPFQEAWAAHLSKERCPRCRLLHKWASRLNGIVDSGVAYFHFPPAPTSLAAAAGAADLYQETHILPADWSLSLRETPEGIVARVEASDITIAGRQVRFHLIGADEVKPLAATFAATEGGRAIYAESAPYPEWLGRLGTGCAVVLELS